MATGPSRGDETTDAWRALKLLVERLDPIAHRDEPGDMEAVAVLEDVAMSVSDGHADVRMTYVRLDGERRATLNLRFDTASLAEDLRAGGPEQTVGEGDISTGLLADALFEISEVFEHTVWWSGPDDYFSSWDASGG